MLFMPRFMAAGGSSSKSTSTFARINRSMSITKIFANSVRLMALSFVKTFSNLGSRTLNLQVASTWSTSRQSQMRANNCRKGCGTSDVCRQTRACCEPVSMMEYPSTRAPRTYPGDEPQRLTT